MELSGLGLYAPRALFRGFADTLRPHRGQPFADEVDVNEGEAGEDAVGVLGQALISHLVESELPLHHSKHMFDLGSYLRLGAILPPL